MVALLPQPMLGAQHACAVIGPEHHDGVVVDAVLLQLAQVAPHVIVDLGDGVVVTRPDSADLGIVRVIRRQRHRRRIMEVFGL